ncbi:DNA translocase FtsK [uncultured Cohaesibacter sp.]|uniref:DNA translocase FtsK n=1 Tax=uncultured Cohaesibacter sp. TaxID=1002546 RepID=UPI0029C87356|nr:DNA translocase FtsK [uncultured Cohaesibacter sp.]
MAPSSDTNPVDDGQEDMFQSKQERAAPERNIESLMVEAKKAIIGEGKASTSFVQRRLNIGYNRAVSIMEDLEKEGFISPANYAGKRQILQGSIQPA